MLILWNFFVSAWTPPHTGNIRDRLSVEDQTTVKRLSLIRNELDAMMSVEYQCLGNITEHNIINPL